MRWLFAAAAGCACFSAAVLGTFVPLRTAGGLEYLYVGPGAAALLIASGAALATLLGLHAGLNRVARLWSVT